MNPSSNSPASPDEIVGDSPRMRQLRKQVAMVASCDINVLLHGESGTGKELIARAVHNASGRREGPFIGINCAAIHETLLESELFGHEAGAFTGARHATVGFLRAANGGTILLDEIGDMSLPLQSKLLRVLEERAVVPVGATKPIPIDVHVIAATHHDLAQAIEEGSFREDLYYRLNVARLTIPPLREHRSDIPLLADHLLRRTADILDVPRKRLSPQVLELLTAYDWPGNVRQLGNVIQRGYVFAEGPTIKLEHLPEELISERTEPVITFPTLRDMTRRHVTKALELSGGTRTQAASMLGIDRKSLWRMMRRHHIA